MVRIVSMTREDIPAALEIERLSHPNPWRKESFLEELRRDYSSVYVARIPVEDSSRVAGYICFWSVVDEIQIFNLAVHEAYRCRGIGRALLLHALKQGMERQGRVALLEVSRSNVSARSLYQSVGFRPVGERLAYYGSSGGDAILMELELDRDWQARMLNR